jgi:hypothetical protein
MKRRNDMSKQSLAQVIAHWEKLLGAAEGSSRELPLMEELRLLLGSEMEDVKTLRDRRSAMRAELLRSTREIRSCQSRAKRLASRIQSLARAYVVDRGKLSEFGIKPRLPFRLRPRPERKEDEAPRNPTTL